MRDGREHDETQCRPGKPASTTRSRKCASHSAGLDVIVAEIIEAHAGTMVDNDNNKRRRLVEVQDGCRYGKFGKNKAYELINHERIKAYKMGGKTMIDLDNVDEYHASVPRVQNRGN